MGHDLGYTAVTMLAAAIEAAHSTMAMPNNDGTCMARYPPCIFFFFAIIRHLL